MATTTTHYGFDIPQSTDLVKDGATAIATLGQDIDTAMNTALGTKKSGLVLLNTTSFSAVASQAIPSVFSSTYENYRILIDITDVTADCAIYMKMRSNTTDNSTNYFMGAPNMTIGGVIGSSSQNSQTVGFYLCDLDFGNNLHYGSIGLDLKYPFLTENTTISYQSTAISSGGTLFGNVGSGVHIVETSYNGFNIIASAGNITGKASVYGYNF